MCLLQASSPVGAAALAAVIIYCIRQWCMPAGMPRDLALPNSPKVKVTVPTEFDFASIAGYSGASHSTIAVDVVCLPVPVVAVIGKPISSF